MYSYFNKFRKVEDVLSSNILHGYNMSWQYICTHFNIADNYCLNILYLSVENSNII